MHPQLLALRRAGAAVAVIAVSGAMTLTAVPAEALGTASAVVRLGKPVKIGPVQNLAATPSKPGAAYLVTSSWDALTGAARYDVSLLSSAGTVLASDRVTSPGWLVNTTLGAGSVVRVKVVPVSTTGRRGTAASTSVVLPDLTPPVGTYSVTKSQPAENDVTVTQDSLTDDGSTPAEITRSIDWADPNDSVDGFEPWSTGVNLTHHFVADGVYHASVHLVDKAGNSDDVPVTIAVNDHMAPSATYAAGPARPWARWSRVTLTESGLTDNFSAPSSVTRVVDWGDGSGKTTWAQNTTADHVYSTAGSYTPTVTLTDEAGNSADVSATPLTVVADSTAPVLRFSAPRQRVRYVDSWRTLRGTVTDAGVGAAKVRVKAVEKRGTAWYAYRPATGTWSRYATKTRALSKAGLVQVIPSSTGTWSARINRLRRGTLVLSMTAVDNVGNGSSPTGVRQVLSR
jgi:hypothetical protein